MPKNAVDKPSVDLALLEANTQNVLIETDGFSNVGSAISITSGIVNTIGETTSINLANSSHLISQMWNSTERTELNPQENQGIEARIVSKKLDENGLCINEEIKYLGHNSDGENIEYTQQIEHVHKDGKLVESKINLLVDGKNIETYTVKAGKNIEATPTQIYQIQQVREIWAQKIHEELNMQFDEAYKEFTKLFDGIALDVNGLKKENIDIFAQGGNIMYGRPKSATSLGDKIVRKILQDGKDIPNIDSARALVEDGIGVRLILENSNEDVQTIVERLCSEIGTSEMRITGINNYHGPNITSGYFTDEQIKQIQNAIIFRRNQDVKDGVLTGDKKDVSVITGTHEKATKPTGYAALQMNVRFGNGALGEIQIRGPYMDRIAEKEHIVYDIKQGKNVSEKYTEIKNIILNLSDENRAIYDEYWRLMFEYAFLKDFGYDCEMPTLHLPDEISQKISYEGLCNIK